MMKCLYISLIILSIFPIGSNSYAQNLNQDAQNKLKEYNQDLNKFIHENNKVEQANSLNKIAYLYWENNLLNEAIHSFSQSLELNKKQNNQNGIKSIHYNIGLIYADQNDFQNAVLHFNEGLQIARKINQKEGVYTGLLNKATALKRLNKNQEAINNIKEALIYAQEFNNLKLIRVCYGMLAENYEILGDSENTMKYFEQFASLDKHIKAQEIKDIEAKSTEQVQRAQKEKTESDIALTKKSNQLEETQQSLIEKEEFAKQQELELELKELSIKEKEAQLENEKIIRYGVSIIFIVILLFSLVILQQFSAKKKAYKKLGEQNLQILKQNQDITDSIQYAKRIQAALLPPDNYIKRSLPEHFILYSPRDIVSGDFYWMMNKDDKIIIAAADCTGHGVPGAFMSMLGTAFLNEIITKIVDNKHVFSLQANEILNQLRTYIIDSLHQTGALQESQDGIDMAICIIDPINHKMQYAGAHNPLYVIKNEELTVIKGNRFPVGIHKNADVSFTNHEIDIKENDLIYLFSDGYYDQIGGPQNRKFMSRNFQNLLLSIHKKSLEEQKEILENHFQEWKGDGMQLDDVLVIGIKLDVAKKQKTEKGGYDWSKKSILIAEDTEMNYLFLVEALKPTKVNILRAKDGEEALRIFNETQHIDLILMDINMPKLDGFETTKQIRATSKTIPIIAQTALNIDDAKERSQEVGCDDFILKPIRLNVLLSKLDSYLNL